MDELEWKDPPSHGNARSHYTAIVAQLHAKPGTWALVVKGVSPNRAEPLRRRGCEVRTVSVGGGKHDIYARWPVGDGAG